MTKTPKWNYGIIADTLIEVKELSAELHKVSLSKAPFAQKKIALEQKIADYEEKVSGMKKELLSALNSIAVHTTKEDELRNSINRKLENISIDPQTYRENVKLSTQSDLKNNLDITQVTDELKIEEFLGMSLDDFHVKDLPVRAYNALKAAKTQNFRQLIEWDVTQTELLKYRNTGKKTINGIRSLLARYWLADKRKQK